MKNLTHEKLADLNDKTRTRIIEGMQRDGRFCNNACIADVHIEPEAEGYLSRGRDHLGLCAGRADADGTRPAVIFLDDNLAPYADLRPGVIPYVHPDCPNDFGNQDVEQREKLLKLRGLA